MRSAFCLAAFLSAVLLPGSAWPASLIGDEVVLEFINYGTDGSGPLSTSYSSATVGPGIEFSQAVHFDIAESSIVLSPSSGLLHYGTAEFDTFTVMDLDFDPASIVVGVSFEYNEVPGLSLANISFTNDSVSIVLNGTVWRQFLCGPLGETCVYEAKLLLHTAVVPEPGTGLLVLLGSALLAAARPRGVRV